MTVQTQGHQVFTPVATAPVRGIRGFVLGLAAIIAAGTAIGFAVSADTPRPVVIAPAIPGTIPQAEQREALDRLYAATHADPATAAELAAMQRFHEDNQVAQVPSHAEANQRLENADWAK